MAKILKVNFNGELFLKVKGNEMIFNNREIKIQISDTAGQERFRSITSSYYKIAHGILLLFDLSNEKSFNNIELWINELKNFVNIESVPIILIGNKTDLERRVNNYKLKKYFKNNNLLYFIPFCIIFFFTTHNLILIKHICL